MITNLGERKRTADLTWPPSLALVSKIMASRGEQPEIIRVSLDLRGRENGVEDEGVSVKRLVSRSGVIHIILSMPQSVHAEKANLATAVLFDQIEQLPNNAVVDRVKMSGLRFTKEGVLVFKEFLSTYASSVRHVSLKDILRKNTSRQDETSFNMLIQAFRESEIETLNLSDNILGAYVWKNLANQTGLRQFFLDNVEMDAVSIRELASRLTYADSLENICVVLTNPTGMVAVREACAVLAQCRNVTSVRWANREIDGVEARLPWLGLRQMVMNQLEYNGGVARLEHLVMDGSSMIVAERSIDGLCGALKELKQLKTLKLRDVGLRDSEVRGITAVLQKSQPPLEWLDLSGNFIGAGGAKAISGLANIAPVITNIVTIVLDRNQIDIGAASQLMLTFARSAARDFDLSMYENPVDFCKIAMDLARANAMAEIERNRSNAFGMQNELKRLQAECEGLRNERDSLIATFSLVGIPTQVDEHRLIMDRITRLEEMLTEPRSVNRATERLYSQKQSKRSSSLPLQRSSVNSCSTVSSLSGIRESLNDHGSYHTSCSSTSSFDFGQNIRRLPPSTDERPQAHRSMSFEDESSNAEVDNVHRIKQQLSRATTSAASAMSLSTPSTSCSSISSSSGSFNTPPQPPPVPDQQYQQQRQEEQQERQQQPMRKQKSTRSIQLRTSPKPSSTTDSRRVMLQKASSHRLLGDAPSSPSSSKDA